MANDYTRINIANWFEIPVKDLVRATTFYENVFEVTLSPDVLGGMKLALFPFARARRAQQERSSREKVMSRPMRERSSISPLMTLTRP